VRSSLDRSLDGKGLRPQLADHQGSREQRTHHVDERIEGDGFQFLAFND